MPSIWNLPMKGFGKASQLARKSHGSCVKVSERCSRWCLVDPFALALRESILRSWKKTNFHAWSRCFEKNHSELPDFLRMKARAARVCVHVCGWLQQNFWLPSSFFERDGSKRFHSFGKLFLTGKERVIRQRRERIGQSNSYTAFSTTPRAPVNFWGSSKLVCEGK